MTDHFMLFPSCVPVKGATNSAIYDLSRHRLIMFPSAYFDVLINLDRTVIEESIVRLGWESNRAKIKDLVRYLLESEVAFLTSDPSRFPAFDEQTVSPSLIHNALIDVDAVLHDFDSLLTQLDSLGCEYVQVRCFSSIIGPVEAAQIATAARDTSIRSVELLTRYDRGVSDGRWITALQENKIISRLILHSAPSNTLLPISESESDERVLECVAAEIRSAAACGAIQLSDLCAPSISVYLEAKQFNGCLNKKIGISADGSIRNCPSMSRSFGVAGVTTLEDVVRNAEFRRVWALKKDDIQICKDCEFRYVCTDCRAYVEDPGDELSKPAKCGYDPYTGRWSSQSSERALGRFGLSEIREVV